MKKSLLTLVMAFAFSVMAVAQVTTSSIAGLVTDADGEVIGATIQAIHTPSGTRYGTITNEKGSYAIRGMRVGGPYQIIVSYVGAQTRTFEDVTLALGETYTLNVKLAENADLLDEVVVVGSGSKFTTAKTGATTNISQKMINQMPTVNRSIKDIARLSPYSNGMSLAGGDGRSTNFTIDGANFNNNFGLSSDLPGGGNPISMDAIDEIQVVISPFDVRQTNFVGGGINAVTKSGTNTFKATAYTYQQNDNMQGARVDNTPVTVDKYDDKHVYGATIGGPIIKDKLFFFAAFEKTTSPQPVSSWRPSEDGVANASSYISRTSKADMDKVKNHLMSKYNYNPGSYDSFAEDETNVKFLARLDWNINDNHHAAFRFNTTKNKAWNPVNGNSTDAGYRYRIDRMSSSSMAFSNSNYSMDNNVTSFSFDLNSRFTDKIQNQFLVTYTNIVDARGTNSSEFPMVDIMAGYTADADGNILNQVLEPYMSFGYELFTYNNRVENKILTINDNFTYDLGNHKILAGISYEHQLANNAYMRNGTGYYRYRSLDDFLNGATPETVNITYGLNGVKNPNAQVTFNQFGLYAQDEWDVTKNIKLNYGVRADMLVFNEDDIMTNNNIKKYEYGGRSVDTGKWPDAGLSISPRVGFIWDVMGDKSLKVRGGTGLFVGRLPLVFFTNMPTNSGVIQNQNGLTTSYNSDGSIKSADPLLAQFAGGLITDREELIKKLNSLKPSQFPLDATPDNGAVPKEISGVASDFKMPQVWKSSIAVDYSFPVEFPLTATVEYIYTKNINAVYLNNWDVKDPSQWNGGKGPEYMAGPEKRLLYASDFKYNGKNAYVLSNTHKGFGSTFNTQVSAQPLENLSMMVSYTHTVLKEVSSMPGSNASSAWSSLATINGPNLTSPLNTTNVVPDRLFASLNYTMHGKREGFATHYSIFYDASSRNGYSYIYKNDINGDGIAYDLIYIPKDDSEIKFASEADKKAFWAYVDQDDYLKNHKGEYAKPFSARAPWTHRFDLRIAQDFGLKVGNHMNKLTISLDFQNFGNLLNSRWGVDKIMPGSSYNSLTLLEKVSGGTATEAPVYKMATKNTESYDYSKSVGQTWKVQLGIRYTFN